MRVVLISLLLLFDIRLSAARNLKKYTLKKYEAEDQDVSLLLSEQDREKRRMLKDEWEKWMNEWKRLHVRRRKAGETETQGWRSER